MEVHAPDPDYKHGKHATLTISTTFRAIMAGRNPDRSSINIVDIVRRVVTTMNNHAASVNQAWLYVDVILVSSNKPYCLLDFPNSLVLIFKF